MADSVADKSGFLCAYMSNHPDTLVAYVRYWGKVSEKVTSASMTAIDSKGMNLSYVVKDGVKKTTRILFDPPLSGYDEVKPRLLSMTADAQESLGMTKSPQVTTFHLPLDRNLLFVASLMTLLVYSTISMNTTSSSPTYTFGKIIVGTLGRISVVGSWWVLGIVHTLEGLYALSLAVKHRMGAIVGFQYVVMITLFGFPILTDLRSRIQKARIDSIMKGN